MAKNNFYAVRIGKNPGIYTTWSECQEQVNGFKGSEFKSFKTRVEAENWLGIDYAVKEEHAENVITDDSVEEKHYKELQRYCYVRDQELEDFCTDFFPRPFSDEQKAAIQYISGPCQLFAIPGSGKTTVMIARIGYMVFVKGIKPKSIVSVTFNKNAAAEMKSRYESIFSVRSNEEPLFKTIHGLCNYFLLKYSRIYGKKMPQLIQDENIHVKEEENSDKKEKDSKYTPTKVMKGVLEQFVKDKIGTKNDISVDDDIVQMVLSTVSNIKNRMLPIGEIDCFNTEIEYFVESEDNKDNLPPFRTIALDMNAILESYDEFLRRNNLMDFDEMLSLAYDIMRKEPSSKDRIFGQYQYFNVDEGQDTSKLQHYIIHEIVGDNGKIFMVGDDDQSIYGFRGAEPEMLLDFGSLYPEAKKITMKINYRSDSSIVDTSGRFISSNKRREKKEMMHFSENAGEVYFSTSYDSPGLYHYIAETARSISSEGNTFAILCRKNISLLPILSYLKKDSISFQCPNIDRIREILNDNIIRKIVGILLIINSPRSFEVYKSNYPHLGLYLKKEHLKYVEQTIESANISGSGYNILKIIRSYLKDNPPWKNYDKFPLIDIYLESSKESSYNTIVRIVNECVPPTLLDNIGNRMMISALLSIACIYESIEDFIEEIEYFRNYREPNDVKCPVYVSSIHAAKGREFDSVVIADSLKDYLIDMMPEEVSEPIIEEERRLFYVAMTRAKHRLHVINVDTHFGLGKMDPSQFTYEYLDSSNGVVKNILIPEFYESIGKSTISIKKGKLYIAISGKPAGIYDKWEDCRLSTEHNPNSYGKGITSLSEAQDLLGQDVKNIDIVHYLLKRNVSYLVCHVPLDKLNSIMSDGLNGSIVNSSGTGRYALTYPSQKMIQDMSDCNDVVLRIDVNCLTEIDRGNIFLSTSKDHFDIGHISSLFDDIGTRSEYGISDDFVTDSDCEITIKKTVPSYCIRQVISLNGQQHEFVNSVIKNNDKIKNILDPQYFRPTGFKEKWLKKTCWWNYSDSDSNDYYSEKYRVDYNQENIEFFEHLFGRLLNENSKVFKIAIVGGGNGWELDAIEECISRMDKGVSIECTLIDPIMWPKNDIGSCEREHISKVALVKKDIFDYLEGDIVDFDILYFSRCINYKDMDNDVECLHKLHDLIFELKINVAFAQIELSKDGMTKQYNNEFKNIFGFKSAGISSINAINKRTVLYMHEFNEVMS